MKSIKSPPTTKMPNDLTLRDLFAKDAPDVPEWFEFEAETPRPKRAKYSSLGEFDFDYERWNKQLSINRYFQWRYYYADKMIEQSAKKADWQRISSPMEKADVVCPVYK